MYGHRHHHRHHYHAWRGWRGGWGPRGGMFWLPLLFAFGFFFFILPKLGFLLPFLLIGGALWFMMSPAARDGRWRQWQNEASRWMRCEETGTDEKPKRDEYVTEEKPKREDYV